MRCNNAYKIDSKGQADGLHVALFLFVVVLVGVLGFMSYMLYKGKQTDISNYQADSKPVVSQINNHPLCGAIFDITDRGSSAKSSTPISHIVTK